VTATPNGHHNPRADLVESALPFLPAGTEIRQAFIGQAAPNFFYFIVTYLTGIMSRNKYRCVAVADEAIYVLDSTKWSGGAKPRELAGRMPRHTRLGPVSGRWAEVDLLGERHWVHSGSMTRSPPPTVRAASERFPGDRRLTSASEGVHSRSAR